MNLSIYKRLGTALAEAGLIFEELTDGRIYVKEAATNSVDWQTSFIRNAVNKIVSTIEGSTIGKIVYRNYHDYQNMMVGIVGLPNGMVAYVTYDSGVYSADIMSRSKSVTKLDFVNDGEYLEQSVSSKNLDKFVRDIQKVVD